MKKSTIIQTKDLLDQFGKATKKNKYKRIDYARWKHLASFKSLELTVSKDKNSIVLITPDGYFYNFNLSDQSLGQFIFEYYYPLIMSKNTLKKEDTMDINTCTSSSNRNITTSNYTEYPYNATAVSISANDFYSTNLMGSYGISSTNVTTASLEDTVNDIINNREKEKKMNISKMFNFNFGPVAKNQFAFSPYGLAVKSNDNWIAYNADTNEFFNVDILNVNMDNLIYQLPVAFDAIKPGDILIHQKAPVIVKNINDDGTIKVIDYFTAAVLNILPVKSPFGFNFFTKICPLIDMSNLSASTDNPFGNMLPFIMMNNNKEIDPLVFMFMNNNGSMNFTDNPMLMYFLMASDKKDMLPFLFMMNNKKEVKRD